ncbi:hypothetical protein ATY35_16830 [Vibrio cidicii]|uniref:Oligosaccharide repeat unit polymerase n=1 Tax=Vibrio cidicii TaxID=1763883 RepID=A0ABR5W0F3_9VIBR|nr:hypothetical protein [Vibrio cidicii]KYN85335.1 hypothetical protein ATY35_16830 [Vibrio cidicii]
MKIRNIITGSEFRIILIPCVVYLLGYALFSYVKFSTGYINVLGLFVFLYVPLFSSFVIYISFSLDYMRDIPRSNKFASLINFCSYALPVILLIDRFPDIYHYIFLGGFDVRGMIYFGRGFSIIGQLSLFFSFIYVYTIVSYNKYFSVVFFIVVSMVLGNRQPLLFFGALIIVNFLINSSWRYVRWRVYFGVLFFIALAVLYQFFRTGFSSGFIDGLLIMSGQDGGVINAIMGLLTIYFPNPTVFSLMYGYIDIDNFQPFLYSNKVIRDFLYSPHEIQMSMETIQNTVNSATNAFGRQWASGFLQFYFDLGYLGMAIYSILIFLMSFLSRSNKVLVTIFVSFVLMNLFITPFRDMLVFLIIFSVSLIEFGFYCIKNSD